MGTKNNPGEFDCYSKADPDEPIFVLLARDPLAPNIVRQWANTTFPTNNSEKYKEAMRCANQMEAWLQPPHRSPLTKTPERNSKSPLRIAPDQITPIQTDLFV